MRDKPYLQANVYKRKNKLHCFYCKTFTVYNKIAVFSQICKVSFREALIFQVLIFIADSCHGVAWGCLSPPCQYHVGYHCHFLCWAPRSTNRLHSSFGHVIQPLWDSPIFNVEKPTLVNSEHYYKDQLRHIKIPYKLWNYLHRRGIIDTAFQHKEAMKPSNNILKNSFLNNNKKWWWWKWWEQQ